MADLEDLLRDLTGELSAAKDTLAHYEERRKEFERKFDKDFPDYRHVRECSWKWREQVQNLTGYLERTRRTMISREPQPAPEQQAQPAGYFKQGTSPAPEPVQGATVAPDQKEAPARTPAPFQIDAKDRHLSNALRKAKNWRVGIPLAPSYRHSAASFEIQAVKRTLADHVDYESYVEKGGYDVLDGYAGNNLHTMQEACKALKVDYYALRNEARDVYLDITTYGESGRDYKW